jgi:hypothetical protein
MRTLRHAAVLVLVAAAAVAVFAGAAAALRSLGIQPNTEVVASGPVEITESGGILIIRCEMFLTERYASAVAKRPGAILGTMRRIEFTLCRDNIGGRWTVTSTVEPRTPSSVTFNSYLGTLPNITGVLASAANVGIRTVAGGGRPNCLFRGSLLFLISRIGEPRFNAKTFLSFALSYVEGACGVGTSIEVQGTLLYEPAETLTLSLL